MIDAKRCACWMILPIFLSPAAARTETNSKVDKLYKQGGIAFAKQDYDGAISSCNESLRIDPKHFYSHIGRGTAYLMKKDFGQAIADFGEAIRLIRNDPRTYDDRGFVGTLTDYSAALRLRRFLAGAYQNKANAYKQKLDYKQAIADLTNAISLGRTNFKIKLHQAVHDEDKKYIIRIATDDDCPVRCEQVQVDLYVYRGRLYFELYDFEHALADFSEAIRLNPRLSKVYHYRALVYGALMESERQVADLQEAVRLNPQDSSAYFLLAYLFGSDSGTGFYDLTKARAYARKGCEDTESIHRKAYEIDTRHFAIPVYFDPVRRDNLEEVRLFVSEDKGKTWRHETDCAPSEHSMIFRAPQDGVYWFAVQEVLKNGDKNPDKIEALIPAMKVFVNAEGKALKPQKCYEELEREVEQLRGTAEQLQKKIEQLESNRKRK